MQEPTRDRSRDSSNEQSEPNTTFDIGQQSATHLDNIGRDKNTYHYTDDGSYTAITGSGRWITGLGTLISLVGFGLVLFTFGSAFLYGSLESGPPDFTFFVIGFGLFFVGMVIASIGNAISIARSRKGGKRR